MDFKLKTWVSKIKLKSQIGSTETKKTLSYFKTSVISIIVGIILTSILIVALGADPLQFFLKSINVVFTRSVNRNEFLAWCSIYALFGIGLAIGFKVGLFNMSGSGQAILSMGVSALVLLSLFGDQAGINQAGPETLILVLVIMVIMSMLLSSITGILKVVFNIHEVATSILLNWTVWYTIKWALKNKGFNDGTAEIPMSWLMSFGGSKWLLPIILTAVVFITAWFILTFTTIGYKFKLVGSQKDAASYVGINFKLYIVSATALQGLCIGIGSFVYWAAIKKGLVITNDIIPTIGFDAIAISLIAFNNILGIIPISILWALLQVGLIQAAPAFPQLGREIAPLVFGFIVYSSTFASLFMRLKIIKWSKFKLYIFNDLSLRKNIKLKKQEINVIKKEIKQLRKEGFNVLEFFKVKKEISSVSKENHEQLIILNRNISTIKDEINELKETGFIKFEETSYKSIKRKYINKHKRNTYNLLNKAIQELNVVEEEKTKILQVIKQNKRNKDISKDQKMELIKDQKIKLKKSKLLSKEIDIAWKEIIMSLNNDKKILFQERDKNIKLAKHELNETMSKSVEEFKEKKEIFRLEKDELDKNISNHNELSKDELKNLKLEKKELHRTIAKSVTQLKEKGKILKFDKLMELGEKYGCN